MITDIEMDVLLASLSYQDRDRILRNLVWDVFGDIDEAGNFIFDRDRTPDQVDTLSIVTSLRQEFWPDVYPDGEAKKKEVTTDAETQVGEGSR